MKKSLLIGLLATLSLASCGGAQEPSSTQNTSTNPSSEETTSEVDSDVIGSEVSDDDSVPVSEDSAENTSEDVTFTTSTTSEITSLGKVQNLSYEDGVISFDSVENALEYVLTIQKGDIIKHQKSYDSTSIDISFLELSGGNYLAKVKAKRNTIYGEEGLLDFKVLHVDIDTYVEAEQSIINETHYSGDSAAHGGAYGLAFDDCGQGMYFRYYAFEAGDRDVSVCYSTGMPGSYMTLFANGKNYRVDYTENTGWFGDTKQSAIVKIEDVTLVKGWNELYLIKNGTNEDNPSYGGYAQVDYILIEGTNKSFDLDEFDMTSNIYHLEAEMAHWHWNKITQRPNKWDMFSLGYGCGEMNDSDDGVRFDINIAEAGTYNLRTVMGGNKTVFVTIDGGNYIEKNFGNNTEWDDPVESVDNPLTLDLSAGNHKIDIIVNGSQWFTLDKIVLEKVMEE